MENECPCYEGGSDCYCLCHGREVDGWWKAWPKELGVTHALVLQLLLAGLEET
jgi:hypothetical protein